MNDLSRTAAAPRAARGPMFSQPGLARPVAWAKPHDLCRLRASHAHGRLGKPLVPTSVASPQLGDELFARLLTYGTPHEPHRGDVLFRPGDADVDLIVVDRGSVEVVRTETADVPAAIVAAVDAGGFVGELNLLTGQNVYLLGRVREGGMVYRVAPERLRQLMANDVELSDIVLKALIARRELLQRSTVALAVEIVGTDRSAAALALRTYAASGDDGFIQIDVQLTDDDLGPAWATLGRRPLSFETSIPGVFAVGDVHSGSMKRVAAATGEGASAIASVHKAIATLA